MDFNAPYGRQFMELPLRKQLKKVAQSPSGGLSERYSLGLVKLNDLCLKHADR